MAGGFSRVVSPDVDFDHQFIPTEKHDATYPGQESVRLFPGGGKRGRCYRPCRELRRQYRRQSSVRQKPLNGCLHPCATWAVHLLIPVPIAAHSKEIGNYRRAQQSVLSACVKLRERLYGICRADGWKTIEINYQKCEVQPSSLTGSWKRKAIALAPAHACIEHESDSSVTLSATSIDAY